MNPETTTRRRFLSTFSLGTAAALCSAWQTKVLASPPAIPPNVDRIRIRPSQYPVLAEPGGSLRLNYRRTENALTINRITADRFATLDSTCTHAGCQVGRFRTENGFMRCPCHGSQYDLEGRVFPDQPAPDDLTQFAHAYDAENDTLDIYIPGISLDVQALSLQIAENDTRSIALRLETSAFCTYEIYTRSTLDAAPQIAQFSLQPGGPFTQSQFNSPTSQPTTIYLPAPGDMGFFQLALVLRNAN